MHKGRRSKSASKVVESVDKEWFLGFKRSLTGDGSERSSRYPVQLRDNVNYWREFQWWVVRGGRFRREYVTDHGQIYPRWKPLPIALTRRGFTSVDSTSKSPCARDSLLSAKHISAGAAARTKRREKLERVVKETKRKTQRKIKRKRKKERERERERSNEQRETRRAETKRANERGNDR